MRRVHLANILQLLIHPLTPLWWVRLTVYGLVLAIGTFSLNAYAGIQEYTRVLDRQAVAGQQDQKNFSNALTGYKRLLASIQQYRQHGIDVSGAEAQAHAILQAIKDGNYGKANSAVSSIQTALATALETKQKAEQAAAEEAKRQAEALEASKGDIVGRAQVGDAKSPDTAVTLLQGSSTIATATTDAGGAFTFHVPAGTYTLKLSRNGYATLTKADVQVTAKQSTALTLTLQPIATTPKPTPKPAPTTTVAPTATKYSKYYKQSVETSRGTFAATIMSFELGPGKIKVVVDTAADGDCANDCPVLPVADYVKRNGGIAGINGTYFCPTAYPDCAGKTNSFYWKLFNSRLAKMINPNNFLGEQDPFIMFDNVGNYSYRTAWSGYADSGFPLYAGFSCKPGLVYGSKVILDDNTLDDKQRTSKITRQALGFIGSTMYVVYISSATVIDLASVMESLGMEKALNIDAGGSTGMYYNGAYKLGPGRSVPNALVFVEQ